MEEIQGKKRKITMRMIKLILALGLIFLVISLASAAQCNDSTDNDGDGNTDYSADTGCTSATDNSEDVVLGYADGCLTNGDKLMDVFGNVQYSCTHTSCHVCVLMAESGNYTTLPSKCNGLPSCGFGSGSNGGGGSLDISPPNLTLFSPVSGNIYNSKNVLVNFSSDEKADVYYRDIDDSSSSWKSICSDCKTYARTKSFNEGENNIEFKARDISGNIAYLNRSFVIDSKAPVIRSTSPTKGFVASVFWANIEEENPTSLIMHFGNSAIGFGNENFDLEDDCDINANNPSKRTCSKDIDLSEYDGTDISYWFTLKDIANTSTNSKNITLSVDETAPIVNNPNSFYTLDYSKGAVDFSLDITEQNLLEVGYIVISDFRPMEKKLCTTLVNGICKKSVSFNDGNYNVTVYVRDKAGNRVNLNISFLMDSHAPKITGIEPKSGFATGNFEVTFRERNPEVVTLHYGDETVGLDVEDDCVANTGERYTCNTNVDLSSFDGGTVEYYFVVEDKVGNSDESTHKELKVDTTFPVINNPDSFFIVDGRFVSFSLSITEENFDEATFSYTDGNGKLIEKRICSKLNNAGYCEKRVLFRNGTYNLTVNVIDDASNKIGLPLNLVI